MIGGKSVLAVIPARGGSKGIPRKNIINLAGKPLIVWTIEAAQKSQYIDRVILSSDDDEIIAVAKKWGCEVPFRRPARLARDETPGVAPVLHALEELPGYEYVVLLQPTSPLRTAEDIDSCIEQCVSKGANCCVSVTEPEKSPYWMFTIGEGCRLEPVVKTDTIAVRRQDLPLAYALNGAAYVADSKWLLTQRAFLTAETIAYKMPQERSLDIDTAIDLILAEILLNNVRG
jgi:CMP-N,N'-diacetyllegionaminic acid synthase